MWQISAYKLQFEVLVHCRLRPKCTRTIRPKEINISSNLQIGQQTFQAAA